MDVQQLLSKLTDNLTVGRVFGEPIQHGDVLMIPVVRFRAGAGGCGGPGATNDVSSGGGGGGFDAKAAGVFVLKGESVSWQPALDVTSIVIGGQVAIVVVALVIRSILRRR